MTNLEKRAQQKSCNCKNSKCMKLYCECFSARIPCGSACRCVDCQNSAVRDIYRQGFLSQRRATREQLIRGHKGCACRRSNCTKKYCDCFQSGILCNESCKCVDCQNNQSLTNRKVINQLRKNNSDISNVQNNSNLYSLYLSQNSQHLNSIIGQSNPLRLGQNWLENSAKMLYESASKGTHSSVLDKLIQILSDLEQNITQQQIRFQQRQISQQLDQQKQKQQIINNQQLKMQISSYNIKDNDNNNDNDNAMQQEQQNEQPKETKQKIKKQQEAEQGEDRFGQQAKMEQEQDKK